MKKNTSKNLSKRLLQYGALSAAVLGVADVNGQVTYTDVDPDVVLNVADTFDIDFTNSGAVNVNISNPDGLANGNGALAFPSSGGALVGFVAGLYQYPNLLVAGDIINDASGYTAVGERGDLNYYGCAYSNSQWCGSVVDGLLGVQFQFAGNTHYGWVRMDTDVNGSNEIIIKGYAFEATPDGEIEAGDEGGLGTADQNFNGFNQFVANDNLNLSANTSMDTVVLYDISGKQILTQDLNTANAQVNLSGLNTGVYIARVTIEGSEKSFKFVK